LLFVFLGTTLTCAAGAGLGLAFGVIMGGLGTGAPNPELDAKPLRVQMVETFRGVGKSSLSMAKGFAICGATFTLAECTLESVCR
jgi:import inner membrane translocase subunit TIM22